MTVKITRSTVTVKRQRGERAARSEGDFYHRLKLTLQARRHDCIKRRMSADGHPYGDDKLPYIRERKYKWAIYDGNYAIRSIHSAFNEGSVTMLRASGNRW